MGSKILGFLSNSECFNTVDVGKKWCAVSVYRERGTTQPKVKVPKYQLSAKGIRMYAFQDREEVGLEAATLQKVRNSLLFKSAYF